MTSDTPRLRIGLVGIVALSLFAALFARLWFLQVMTSPSYQASAQSVSTLTVTEQAPRGRILDRNGNVLVGNTRQVAVSIDYQKYSALSGADQQSLRNRLAAELNRDQPNQSPVTPDEITARLNNKRYSHFKPVPIATDLSPQLWVYLAEHQAEFPSVSVERQEVREYKYGTLLSHVLGYTGAITSEELHQLQNDKAPYANDDLVGKAGVEKSFENLLHGVPGKTVYEVDARNKPVRVISRTPPIPGYDVYLTIDINVQAMAEKALATELFKARTQPDSGTPGLPPAPAGSTVIEDPANGEVLAMASYPTFDPTQFVGGISQAQYDALTDPNRFQPFTNRATEGLYAPGSTFKLITSLAGLRTGDITPQTSYYDDGSFTIPNCNGPGCVIKSPGATGSVELPQAITRSSDPYFYKIGYELWVGRSHFGETPIQDVAISFGYGSKTGIELPLDYKGVIPTPTRRQQQQAANPGQHLDSWGVGDNINMSIGQGEVLVTPLQLTNAYATFANGGTRWQPSLLLKVNDANSPHTVAVSQHKQLGQVALPPEFRDPMMQGFLGVTEGDGTAAAAFQGFPQDKMRVAGKTGTAEIGPDPKTGERRHDTSLFVGFGGMADGRQFVATSVMEQSGFGSSVAAPVVRDELQAIVDGSVGFAPLGGFPLDENGRPVFPETSVPGPGQAPPPPTNGEAH